MSKIVDQKKNVNKMSTNALVPFTFNDRKLFTLTIDGKSWTRGREPVQALGYSKHTKTAHVIKDLCTAENIRQKDQLIGVVDTSVQWPANSQKYDLYINEEGMHELVLKSSMFNATDFAKAFGINIHDHKYLSKERETLSCILKAFKGQEMKEQYTVDGYRVDLYFPSHKLAIECDEFGHKDRDIGYEVTRQKYIETKLGCTFIRYNPDAKDFDIFIVINSIMKYIYKQ